MIESKVVSLTAALRVNSVRSSQHEETPASGQWTVIADSTTPYTMTQLANLETTHGIGAVTDRAEFGPGTQAAISGLEAALRTSRVMYTTYEKVVNSDQWYCRATSGVERTVAQIQSLETTHSLVAKTTRARFT